MKVLVTGATGFIGRYLVRRLISDGRQVRALVLPDEDTSTINHCGAEIVRGNVVDYQSVKQAASSCRQIFHLAGKTEASGASRTDFTGVNVQGTENVARAALSVGVDRLVFSSSGAAYYGKDLSNRAISEETKPFPDSPYGRSKFQAEQVLLSHHRCANLPVVLARINAVLGPGAMSWLNLFRTIADGKFRLIGEGNNYHHPSDIADIVEGLALCGSIPGIEGQAFILVGAKPVRFRDLVATIIEAVGAPKMPSSLPAGPFHLYQRMSRHFFSWTGRRLPRADRSDLYFGDQAFDLSRSRRVLGYIPKVSTKEAVRRTATWFKKQGYL